MLTFLLSFYVLFFIGYSLFVFIGVQREDSLIKLRGKVVFGIVVLFTIFVLSLALMYGWLSSNGYGFQTKYSAKINPTTKTVIVGTSKECDIILANKFSDKEHVVFDFSAKPSMEVLSNRRSAIVNSALITRKSRKGTTTVSEASIKDGDIIRLGYSDYKIYFDNNRVDLENLFFTPSFINIFNIYSTTTLPNVTQNSNVDTISIWRLFAVTVFVALLMLAFIIKVLNSLTQSFGFIGEKRYVIYPILYFSLFLAFLFFASLIEFTVLQFFQFSVYNKGALYTVLLVYLTMFLIAFIAKLGFNRDSKSTLVAIVLIVSIVVLPLHFSNVIYSSSYILGINKSALFTSIEWLFMFVVFGFLFGRFIGNVIFDKSLFTAASVNIKFIVKWLLISLVIAIAGLVLSFLFHEGAGIVLIETIKLFIFFLFSIILLDDFNTKKKKFSYIFLTSAALILLMSAIVFGLKDMGSLIQVALAIAIISLFFYNRLMEVGFINKKTLLSLLLLFMVGGYFAFGYLSDNIRFDMWLAPFEQNLAVNNKFYLYYFDQIARGLLLTRQANFLPNDFIQYGFIVLPNMHTDFIFALFVNVFGILGFFAIIVAFLITIFSFGKSIQLYQNSKKDIYRFIYGINVIFVAYFFSYIIINILSVLQIFPLTDVPFPILTYARGVLILFFVFYIFVILVNYLYLRAINKDFRSKV